MEELKGYEAKQLVNLADYAMSKNQMLAQVQAIQDTLKSVMKDGEHYGKIPGCGDKPSLLKPGAEKISATFHLAPSYGIISTDLAKGHREYQVTCTLTHIITGAIVGQGVGSCSTMESKFRYRWDNTHKGVPQEYWKNRDASLLGGNEFVPRKVDKVWLVFQRIEHDNPADYYNLCLKMAKKRAHVDGILTVTAASDIFTQDIEDILVDIDNVPSEQKVEPEGELTLDQKKQEMAKWFDNQYGGESLTEFQKMTKGVFDNPLTIKVEKNISLCYKKYLVLKKSIEEEEEEEE